MSSKQKTSSKSPKGRSQRSQVQGNGSARTPLLPSGVNNKATMPDQAGSYTYQAEELLSLINVSAGSTPGQLIYNALITPSSCRRLALLAGAWQRIDWKQATVHLVALNGSVVQSGYTMGFVEDPEIVPPTSSSGVIGFLTALRSTTVRQNWVESTSGVQVAMPDKPEMYTQLGSDVRRYSPGRLMVAVAGDVAQQATFQLMLKYRVRLYVPLAVIPMSQTPEDAVISSTINISASPFTINGQTWTSPTSVVTLNRGYMCFLTTTLTNQGRVWFPAGTRVTCVIGTAYTTMTAVDTGVVGQVVYSATAGGDTLAYYRPGVPTGYTFQ